MEKTLRDEFAIILDSSLIPTLNNDEEIALVAEKYGLEYDKNDILKRIDFSLKYQSIIRYQFANQMLNERKK